MDYRCGGEPIASRRHQLDKRSVAIDKVIRKDAEDSVGAITPSRNYEEGGIHWKYKRKRKPQEEGRVYHQHWVVAQHSLPPRAVFPVQSHACPSIYIRTP